MKILKRAYIGILNILFVFAILTRFIWWWVPLLFKTTSSVCFEQWSDYMEEYSVDDDNLASTELNKPDKYKVLISGNVTVAQGYECNRCKVIRSYNQPKCNCH